MKPRRPPRRQEREADETVIIVDREYVLQKIRATTMELNLWRRLIGLEPVSSLRRSKEADNGELGHAGEVDRNG